jgi:Domain of unknown function (DUF4271)
MAAAQPAVDSINNPVKDSLARVDSLRIKDSLNAAATDTLQRRVLLDSTRPLQAVSPLSFQPIIWTFVPLVETKPTVPQKHEGSIREVKGKEMLFYLLVLLFIAFAVLRRAFPKYFNDLFRLFFRTTIKQRQIREQLMQTPLPSLMLNGFYMLSAGLYIAFLMQHFGLDPVGNFWLMFLYCALGLSTAYFIKYAGLKICGWLFNLEEAADSYIFIVFIINKMIGVLLLPFLLVLAFSLGDVYSTGLTLSWCMVGAMLGYRIILTYGAIRNQVKVNPFHFFLYLCAFEIAPLLLVYKALLIFLRQTT